MPHDVNNNQIISVIGSRTKQFRVILRDKQIGLPICWGDCQETFSGVDDIQSLSSISPHDGAVANE